MFDCILPSQLAQRGVAFTSLGKFQLRRSVYKLSEERLDPACSCETCATYSRAYLHHLVKSDEVLGWHLIAKHNIHFYHQLMREIRESILEDRFLEYYEQKRLKLIQVDEENPSTPFIPAKVSKAEKRKKLGDYEVHLSEKGFASIKQVSSGEIMHSVNPPEEEARHLYLNPSRIQERLEHQDEIVIWDVGLGAATNAMAVIHSLTELQPSKKVRIESFEIDLDPLRLALKHPHHFSYLKHAAPHALIRDGLWKNASGNLEWKLHEGDFFETLRSASPPDLIFFDPFSSKVDSKLWMKACFARIREQAGDKPFMLMTYSVSTLVRALFLEQGFYVGRGAPSGPKAETTLVFSQEPGPEYQSSLLGAEWMIRWERSGAKAPSGLSASELQEFESRIRSHPQFSKSN
jgi:queuine tRNA-ribosyltransferase